MNRDRALRAVGAFSACMVGGLVTAGVAFAVTAMACEWLKVREGRESPAVFCALMLSTCYVPVFAVGGGWVGWRLNAATRRSPKLGRA